LYDQFIDRGATVLAISGDKQAKQEDFRRALKAEYAFVADPDGSLIRAYGVKAPLVTLARRTTFVIGKERKILRIFQGTEALDSDGALQACSLF
jgi:peroxiredoxin